jgi:hypothetical protein
MMGTTADELAERISEAEFREHFADMNIEPDASGKLDVVIALLWSILEANTSLAATWIKGYQRPDTQEHVPLWGRRKRKRKGPISPSAVLAMVASMNRTGNGSLSG